MKHRLLSLIPRLSSLLPSWLLWGAAFLLTHVPFLTALPVFADEAIYIRWSQLFTDEPYRFAFFSMADGKPPLFIWILSPFLQMFADPLFAGRFASVLIGMLTMFAVGQTAFLLTGRRRVMHISYALVLCLPFWWFYHRMSLMDGLLTLLLTLSLYFALKIAIFCQKERGIAYDMIPYVLLLALSFGGALMTKTPALFAIPIIALVPFFSLVRQNGQTRSQREKLYESLLLTAAGGVMGCLLFVLLRISPLFGALFSRSSDFGFTIHELLGGEWRYVLFGSLPREIGWLSWYLTYPLIAFACWGVWVRGIRKTVGFLLLAALLFAAPLILFGRVLYPRYFLPIAPFVTIAGAISIERMLRLRGLRSLALLGIVLIVSLSSMHIFPSYGQPSLLPLVTIDRIQYLEEWSAGYGNREVRDYIRARYQELGGTPQIYVLTEGSFGTLPDGLLMYFWRENQLEGVQVHGIGVGPSQIPTQYLPEQVNGEVYYVVNSHRLKIEDQNSIEKILEVKRPGSIATLQLYKVR